MREDICARLCLLTRAAWSDELPPPLFRRDVHRMIETGALQGLVLRSVPQIDDKLLTRAKLLLSRAHAVYACMQAYAAQGYRVLLPQDADWPRALYKLGTHMPLFLFARGNLSLLEGEKLAVAGSRQISYRTDALAQHIGRQMARESLIMVCGGAIGVDTAAQDGLLEAGGSLILVPAMPVHALMRQDVLLRAMADGRLLVLCDALPDEPFSHGKALGRNHTIYALGSAALVLASRDGTGGSWRGARDCLKGGWSPVYVTDDGMADMAGNRALLAQGARRLPLPLTGELGTLLVSWGDGGDAHAEA